MSNRPYLDGWPILFSLCLLTAVGCGSALPWKRAADQESPVLDEHQHVDVQLALGRTFEKQQRWEAARTVYSEILRRHPDRAEAAHRLAIVYDRRQDRESAARWFEHALKHDPDNADIFCDIAYSLYQQGEMAGAEANFRQALLLEPNHRRAQNQLGLVLARTNRREEALKQFRMAGCTPSEAHSNLAFALSLQRQTEQAEAEWQIASRSAPKLPEHRRRLDAVAALIEEVAESNRAPVANADSVEVVQTASAESSAHSPGGGKTTRR